MDVDAVADYVLSKGVSERARSEVVQCLRKFSPSSPKDSGYLSWRYACEQQVVPLDSSGNVHGELAAIARLVDSEKELIEGLAKDHGACLANPKLAKRALVSDFIDLIDPDDYGRSAADELRRIRAKDRFLRRAVVLCLVARDLSLLDYRMEYLYPPAPDQLIETTPSLQAAIDRLNGRIKCFSSLSPATKSALNRFYRWSNADLTDLQTGRLDFFRRFRDLDRTLRDVAPSVHNLPFEILPKGERLASRLRSMRMSWQYGGYALDHNRQQVLRELEDYFGSNNCDWYIGLESSQGLDNEYLVLVIQSTRSGDSHEDAVAISPLVGRHAAYLVRGDCSPAHWSQVLSRPKSEARTLGARRLLFGGASTHDIGQYSAMREKIIGLLHCPPTDFLGQRASRGQRGAAKGRNLPKAAIAKPLTERDIRRIRRLFSPSQRSAIRHQVRTSSDAKRIIADTARRYGLDERAITALVAGAAQAAHVMTDRADPETDPESPNCVTG